MAKKKFYAVQNGRVPGVYLTWDECKKQVDGYSGASYKSFQVMNSLCPVMEAAALLGKIMFDTGNFPIILVTVLWAVQTGVYCFYSAQYDRRGAGE